MISNLHKNVMGTTSFDAKFEGMRKPQEFDIYPIKGGHSANEVTIQSDSRIGVISLVTGEVKITKSIPSGAFFHHLALVQPAGSLQQQVLDTLKQHVLSTASAKAGVLHVTCDNSGAAQVPA